MLTPLLLALGLLTRLPVAYAIDGQAYSERNRRRASHWFGTVGMLLTAVLSGAGAGLQILPPSVASVLLVCCWVAATGGLHLDGLADCTDAAAAGHQHRERTLAVMKAPDVGAMAVIALVLQLLLKAALLHSLLTTLTGPELTLCLGFALVASRLSAAMYMQITPYAREQGLGLAMDRKNVWIDALQLIAVMLLLVCAGQIALALLGALLVLLSLLLWRHFWQVRIAGYTGDCVGALIEIQETLLLLAALACLGISP